MKCKTFRICDTEIRFQCGEQIKDMDYFSLFRSSGLLTPDITVKILRRSLPKADGKEIFRSARRRRTLCDGLVYDYSYFPQSARLEPVPYACSIISGAEITLYIDYAEPLWDTLLFDAVSFPDLLLERGSAIVHSSFISVNGEGVIFAGQKQIGKSTQAELWRKEKNAVVVNGDRVGMRKTEKGYAAYGLPFCGTSNICLNLQMPLRAIVFPEKGNENAAETLSEIDAFKRLLGCMSYSEADPSFQDKAIAFAESTVSSCPCFRLVCRPDSGAVEALSKELFKE